MVKTYKLDSQNASAQNRNKRLPPKRGWRKARESSAPDHWAKHRIISRVNRANDVTTRDISLFDFLQGVQTGAFSMGPVGQIRRVWDEAEAKGEDPKAAIKPLKLKLLRGVTPSGNFSRRDNDHLKEHSGIQCADLDGVELSDIDSVRTKLTTSPHIAAVFVSPSGRGIKALFATPRSPEHHQASFRAIDAHVFDLTRHRIDPACKALAQLCYESFDPRIWVSQNEPTPIPIDVNVQPGDLQTEGIQLAVNGSGDGVGWKKEGEETHSDKADTGEGHCTHTSQNPQNPQNSCTVREKGKRGGSVSYVSSEDDAITLCVPVAPHTSHRLLCKLAGALKAYAEHSGDTLSKERLRSAHRMWFEKSKRFLDPSQTEPDYYLEFMDAWKNAKPLGESSVDVAWRLSENSSTPPELVKVDLTDSPRLVRLTAFLRQLQLLNRHAPFFISPYKIMQLFKQNSASTACYWLSGLCECGVLTLVQKGITKKRAAEYRYNFLKK